MNRKQWYNYRRNWRLASPSLYEEESPISYERRLEIEEHFKAAQKARAPYTWEGPSNILYLWGRALNAINNGADKEKVFRIVRYYMRHNSGYTGRERIGGSYPANWSWEAPL